MLWKRTCIIRYTTIATLISRNYRSTSCLYQSLCQLVRVDIPRTWGPHADDVRCFQLPWRHLWGTLESLHGFMISHVTHVRHSLGFSPRIAFDWSPLSEAISFSDPISFALPAGSRYPSSTEMDSTCCLMPAFQGPKMRPYVRKLVGELVRVEDRTCDHEKHRNSRVEQRSQG